MRKFLPVLLCGVLLAPAAPANDAAPALQRPKVALVLSGGGARGFAHIGVLRVLRELRVPVDIVVGTSMGSVVGGAYAAGASVSELERIARETDWGAVIADRPARDMLAFRRREEDILLPSRIEFGVSREGLTLPPAAAGNATLEKVLGDALPPGTRDKPVNQLPLPFRSVASDLVTGELVDLADTPLFLTLRASLAVPGVFQPVRVRDRLVVDGGLVRNLPVDMAHAMGADVVIAVNVGTPLAPEKDLRSAIGVANQMLQILTEQNVQRSIKELLPQDILIAPDLSGVSFLDFQNYARAIDLGEQAARAMAPRLAALALDAQAYAVHEHRRLAAPALDDAPLPLAKLEVQASGNLEPDALAAQSGLERGAPVTRAQVREAVHSLYGRGDLQRVEADVNDDGGKRTVTIRAAESPWATNRARVGLELASDFRDTNNFALKLMHVRSALNPSGGELRTVARIGTQRAFGMQFFQPLGAGANWYVAPDIQYNSFGSDVFNDGHRQARLSYDTASVSAVLGRQIGNFGDLQFGIARQRIGIRKTIPDDALAVHGFDITHFLRYRVDTLDSLAFPSRGMLINAELQQSTADTTHDAQARSAFSWLGAFHRAEWAGHAAFEWARARQGTAPQVLGGFLRLSGTATDSVQGRSVALTRLVMARKMMTLPSALGGLMRVGFSVEAGGGFDHDQPIRGASFKQAGSAFVSVDTRFGPAFLALGATKDGARTAYVFLGPIW
nr:patatin-like phospholipase family protein [Massilia sp. TS11]